ncbi:MAG TPA: GNAT family N-acetyltransferase [Candidatus Deferrimicrobium sp.]|nr:GNAT family N-acetyltransferase [Candidatus Deferrimicrobium sp.]
MAGSTMTDRQTARVSRVDSSEGFVQLKPVWNGLLAEQTHTTVYLTHEWLSAWWEVFGKHHELYLLVVSVDSDIVCIAPLIRSTYSRFGRRRRLLQFMGAPNADYHDLVGKATPVIVDALVSYLSDHAADWDRLQFTELSERSTTWSHVEDSLHRRRLLTVTRTVNVCLAFAFEGDQMQQGQFTFHKSRNFKKAVNFYKTMVGQSLRKIDDIGEADRLLSTLFTLHINRWRGTLTPSKFERSDNRAFYRALLAHLWPGRRVNVVSLAVQDIPVCCSINFEYNQAVYHYTMAYNTLFNKRSPGVFFLTLQSETFVRQGLFLDFCRGQQPYKQALANRSFANYEITVHRSRLSYVLARQYEALKRRRSVARILNQPKVQALKAAVVDFYNFYGLKGTLPALARAVTGYFIKYTAWHYYSLREDTAPAVAGRPGLIIEEKGPGSLDAVASFLGLVQESPAYERLRRSLEAGARIFAAIDNGLLAAVSAVYSDSEQLSLAKLPPAINDGELLISWPVLSPVADNAEIVDQLLAEVSRYCRESGSRPVVVTSGRDGAARDRLAALGHVPGARRRTLTIFGLKLF